MNNERMREAGILHIQPKWGDVCRKDVMRVFIIILIKFCILNDVLAQNIDLSFAKDVRIVVDNQVQRRLTDATVKFIAREKIYYAEYVVVNQNYRFDSLPMIKGTFKVSHPGYESQSRKAVPVDKGWSTNETYPYQFTLGKPGNAYTIRDNRLYPYTPDDFGWAFSYGRNDYDSIVHYLHQNGFVVYRHFEEVRALIVYPYRDSLETDKFLPGEDQTPIKINKQPEPEKWMENRYWKPDQTPVRINKQSRAEQYETLLNFELIRVLGPLGRHELYGQIFLSNHLNIKFVKFTKPEEKQKIYDKYNLEFYKLGPALIHHVRVLKNGHRINEIAIELMKEPIIAYIGTHLAGFGKIPLD